MPDTVPPDDASPLFWPLSPIAAPEAEPVLPLPAIDEQQNVHTGGVGGDEFELLDFGERRRPVKRILVLKLDHFGDFIIGLPALRAIRTAFPLAHIRLVCGTWNEANAVACGLADEVRCYNFFPEHPHGNAPQRHVPPRTFDKVAEGRFDLAFDLRVDDDTRHLLGRVNAGLRCGIGSVQRFPFLDIALPDEHEVRAIVGDAVGNCVFLSPGQFNSSLPTKGALHQFGPLVPGDILRGPFVQLPSGQLRAEVQLGIRGHVPWVSPYAVHVEVVCDGGKVIAHKAFGRREILRLRNKPVVLEFENTTPWSRFEFRASVTGRPSRGTVRFSGVAVSQVRSGPVARFRPSGLHIGEKLTLLVALVQSRVTDLYAPLMPPPPETDAGPDGARKSGRLRIVVAPFSNSTIRDWPAEHYAELIAAMLERLPCQVILVGTIKQIPKSRAITERLHSPFLVNLVGQTTWDGVQEILANSDLVICNNSGIAHQAAAIGARVLAIYSASHQPQEWGPRGMHAQAIMRRVPCSPCGFERLEECPADHACMRLITPHFVFTRARALLDAAENAPPRPLRSAEQAFTAAGFS